MLIMTFKAYLDMFLACPVAYANTRLCVGSREPFNPGLKPGGFLAHDKIIVIMRSKKEWYQAVSGLENYDRKMILKNPRQPYISIGNLGEDNFRTIVQTLINT
jgi:hypothetical protein